MEMQMTGKDANEQIDSAEDIAPKAPVELSDIDVEAAAGGKAAKPGTVYDGGGVKFE